MQNLIHVKYGHKFRPIIREDHHEFAINYKPANDDLFLVTYPKTGTNWTLHLIRLTVDNGVPIGTIDRNFPIEYYGREAVFKPCICTHLAHDLLPKNPMAKYLYVFRNPKDTVVSLYHHFRGRHMDESVDFHRFFSEWITGQWMDYFEYVPDYWRHRLDGKSDYLVYEHMKRNPKEAVLKIANFLGKEFVDKLLANNELALNEVLKKSSFDVMNSNKSSSGGHLFRKGVVGDWRSHLTRDESDLIDAKFKEYFTGTELESIWREDMKW